VEKVPREGGVVVRESVDSTPGIVRNPDPWSCLEAEVDNPWMTLATCSGGYLQRSNRLAPLIHKPTVLTGTTTIVLS
jgi:hypothetical protein